MARLDYPMMEATVERLADETQQMNGRSPRALVDNWTATRDVDADDLSRFMADLMPIFLEGLLITGDPEASIHGLCGLAFHLGYECAVQQHHLGGHAWPTI